MKPMQVFTRLLRRKVTLLSASILLSISTGHAETVTIDFNSLPSGQGWTYVGSPLAENNAFFVDGSSLTQTTVGSGYSIALYQRNGLLDSSKRMTLSFTSRVLSYERLSFDSTGLGFNFVIHDGVTQHRLAMTDTLLQVDRKFYPLDTTVFRSYVFDMKPGGSFDLFVDGVLFASGTGTVTGPGNAFLFGDTTSHENTDAEITALSFAVVTVPEDLINDIEALVESGILDGDQADGLIDKIDAVIASLDRGVTTAACNQLRAFLNQVAAFVVSENLTPEEGQALIDSAINIAEENGCYQTD